MKGHQKKAERILGSFSASGGSLVWKDGWCKVSQLLLFFVVSFFLSFFFGHIVAYGAPPGIQIQVSVETYVAGTAMPDLYLTVPGGGGSNLCPSAAETPPIPLCQDLIIFL